MSKQRKNDLEEFEQMLRNLEIPQARPEYLQELYSIPSAEKNSAGLKSRQRLWWKAGIPVGIAALFALVFWTVQQSVVFYPPVAPLAQGEVETPPLSDSLPQSVVPSQALIKEQPPLPKVQFVSAISKSIPEIYTLTMLSTNEKPQTLVFMGAESIMEPWKIRELAQNLALTVPNEFQLSSDYEKNSRKVEWKCRLSEEESRDYQPISEKSYWVATNDLGLAKMSNGQTVRVLQEIWVDKQIALSREGKKVLEITQSRGELTPALLES